METALKEQLHIIAEKLENILFGGHTQPNEEQRAYFQSFFVTGDSMFSRDVLKYFKKELYIGFFFNLILLGVLTIYLPYNLEMCWSCNPILALWLFILTSLNAVLVLPKSLLIRRLSLIEETSDVNLANYATWNFFRSKIYKFNMVMSRYIFCTYLFGTIMLVFTWTPAEECDTFFGWIAFLVGSFVVRVIGSFYKFIHNFGNGEQAENIIEMFNGSSHEEIQSLDICKHSEYLLNFKRDDKYCAICYEKYNTEDEVRIMKCPGDHAFHKKCIDKWLMKSNRCPQCNLSIFWKTEANTKKLKYR